MRIRTSAPGKVVLSGEYAVLEGAPAIVMAVDRRARVCLSPADGDWHRVSTQGLEECQVDFSIGKAGEMIGRNAGTTTDSVDLSLVGRVLTSVGARPPGPLHFELDTRAFFHEAGNLKLGFGSSAALAVALVAALMRDRAPSGEVERTASVAHRAWQGGRGSGVDIAAAVHGGLHAYRATPGAVVEPLCWPQGLRYAVLWSGRSASTGRRIEAFRQSARRYGAATALSQAADEILTTWRRGEACAIMGGLSRYVRVLDAFDLERDLGIFEAGHRELAGMGEGGVVYKPCGAGGGDIGIAFALQEEDLDGFVEKARAHGFERLNVVPDSRGVE